MMPEASEAESFGWQVDQRKHEDRKDHDAGTNAPGAKGMDFKYLQIVEINGKNQARQC